MKTPNKPNTIIIRYNDNIINHKVFSLFVRFEASPYLFSHLSPGTKYKHIKTKKFTYGIQISNCHHHENQISWNLLFIIQIPQYMEAIHKIINKKYAIHSNLADSNAIAIA